MIKKLLSIILVLLMAFAIGCSKNNEDKTSEESEKEIEEINDDQGKEEGNENGEGNKEDESGDEGEGKEEEKLDPIDLVIPNDSSVYDKDFANKLLRMNLGSTENNVKKLVESAGFEVVKQVHFNKTDYDAGHTTGYTIGTKKEVINGSTRDVIFIIARGTSGVGEWISNFDFTPSKDENGVYAENFYACAQDVYKGVKNIIEEKEDPVIIVTGYSRGAACANLLGGILDDAYGEEDIYVYTFATPNTVREKSKVYSNIFNIINGNDFVTKLPPIFFMFERLGEDKIYTVENSNYEDLTMNILIEMAMLCESIPSYYNDKHSLQNSGLSSDGMTVFEFFVQMSNFISMAIDMYTDEENELDILSLSDIELSSISIDLGDVNISEIISKTFIGNISEESDFYPFISAFKEGIESGYLLPLLLQHAPIFYMSLLV